MPALPHVDRLKAGGLVGVDADAGVAIPRRFFKIAAWVQDSELAATGYVLDQTPSLGPILTRPARTETATPPLGPYRTFQVPIEDIAADTGLSMDQLIGADRYTLQPAARPVGERWTELTAYADISL
ncbi:DNA/RNA non-specific endonuclease [Rhodococcus sp. 114MFTsu3.1]|uniref:DNA/RNA non-specific endonuclease n=1 Tax=Rhodococcus sp. 114MFTsu3.1 TaxID=1172184 RepID=UPI0003A0B661|nr:DNA/RNA non-specific endonuclease [Rhodococcus sp. 114MFTsu3.1]